MDDFNKLATMDEITAHFKSLDVPVPICWLLNGKLNFLTGGNPGMDFVFSEGTIEDAFGQVTADYTLIRFENGYMMYSMLVRIDNYNLSTSPELFYDTELPAHFTKTPKTTMMFNRTGFAVCNLYSDYNSDHLTDYMPTISLFPRTTGGLNTAAGYVTIQMEGF